MLIFGIVLSVSFEKMSQNGDYSLEKVYICSKNSFEKMLRRKIEGTLAKWKNTSGHKPLVISQLASLFRSSTSTSQMSSMVDSSTRSLVE